MLTIPCYYYKNKVNVQFNSIDNINPAIIRRHRIVYTRSVKLYKGVDNVIQFTFLNEDQKRVNINGWTVKFNVVSDEESSLVISKDVTVIDANVGVVTATVSELDLVDLNLPRYNYSLTITDPYGSEQVVYADDNYGVRGEIEVLDGPYPKFKPSISVSLPSSNTNIITSSVASDTPSRQQSAHHTTQFYFNQFTGNIAVQGTLDTLPEVGNIAGATLNWSTVSTLPFISQNVPSFYNFDGVYTAVRFVITADSGEVSKILYRA